MTGRERLRAVFGRQPTDRLPWTALVDSCSLSHFPPEITGNYGLDFYRYLGCDIFLLGGWNTPYGFQTPRLHWTPGTSERTETQGPRRTTVWQTPLGDLTMIYEGAHPVKFPVDSEAALRIYRWMWEGARYEAGDDTEAFATIDGLIGDEGVTTYFGCTSALPLLLQIHMGMENFYYLLADHPAEMDALIRTIHERQLEAFRLVAAGPWESVTMCENTSTSYLSPRLYERYNLGHQRDFCTIMQAAGKTALLHMCGLVKDLLPLIKETGCDGLHTLTPPPTGNTPWELALDVLGDDLILLGCLDPTVWVLGPVEGIAPALDRLITPRLRESPFVLSVMADGLAVPQERFEAVASWCESRARR